MKKILVVDWLEKYGGAERVLTALNRQFDFEKCYTLINIMSNNDLTKVFLNKNVQIKNNLMIEQYTAGGAADTYLTLEKKFIRF